MEISGLFQKVMRVLLLGGFWGTAKNTPKSVEDLAGMYFNSVGHNSPLLLNIPPNDKGKVDDANFKKSSRVRKEYPRYI